MGIMLKNCWDYLIMTNQDKKPVVSLSRRVNMQFDEDESMHIEQLQKHYGIKQLTELIRFTIKMQYNRMIAQE